MCRFTSLWTRWCIARPDADISRVLPSSTGRFGSKAAFASVRYRPFAAVRGVYETTGDSHSRRHDDLNLRLLLEKRELSAIIQEPISDCLRDKALSLCQGSMVDATIIQTCSSTTIKQGRRNPEMHQPNKGNQYCFRVKPRIGADAESG